MVRPGGWLCHATCTFSPDEYEKVVASFLLDHPEFKIVEPPDYPCFGHGHPEWVETPDPLNCAWLALPGGWGRFAQGVSSPAMPWPWPCAGERPA
jgi:16S rRNA C967 or C1407 C5-methylase (RsmB/RsmF family)